MLIDDGMFGLAAIRAEGAEVPPEDVDHFRTDGCGIPPGTWSNREIAPPLTIEGLREGIRFYEELADREMASWDEPMLRMVSEGLPEAFRVAPSPMVEPWCQAYLEQNGAPCRCYLCEPLTAPDNVTDELMALVRAGDEVGFRELAVCVMPAGEVDECWAGARGRLGLPARQTEEVR